MAIGFHIELGSISGVTFDGSKDDAWVQVRGIVADIREDPVLIAQHIPMLLRNRLLPDMHEDDFYEYIEIYKHDKKGTPVRDSESSFMVVCSGGGDSRIAKEIVARAFVWVVMTECHRFGIDINITVA